MRLRDRLGQLDDRVLGDAPADPPEPTATQERRLLMRAALGAVVMMLALVLAADEWWGVGVAMAAQFVLGSPYIDLRVRRWLRG